MLAALHEPIRQQFSAHCVARHQKEVGAQTMPRLWKRVSLLFKSKFESHPALPAVEKEVS
jgi:hypothetical protein